MRLREIVWSCVVVMAFVSSGGSLASPPVPAHEAGSCMRSVRICGLSGPEDLVAIDKGAAVLASRLGGSGLNVIDVRTGAVSAIDPDSLVETPAPEYPCRPLKSSGVFISHGLSIKPQSDGHDRLFVVRHGGREAVEIFQFSRPGDLSSLTWLGCVPLPKGFAGNAVTGRRDGGFYVTSMTDRGDAPGSSKLAKLYAGLPSGSVLGWTAAAGFQPVQIGTMSGPNGIELSADDRWLYINGWASHEIVRLDLAHPGSKIKQIKVSFMPDNLRWANDGTLLAAGVKSTPKAVFECAGTRNDGRPCVTRWAVVRVNPTSMLIQKDLSLDDSSGFGDVSVALQVGLTLWLGAFDGQAIAIEPYDPLNGLHL